MTSPFLRALSYRLPDVPSALAELARLSAVLTLPRGAIHVVSDVHGEFRKLEHVFRNGSGSLRPLVKHIFDGRLSEEEEDRLLNFVYYPRETWQRFESSAPPDFLRDTIFRQVEILRVQCERYGLRQITRLVPPSIAGIFEELLFAPVLDRELDYLNGLLAPFVADDGGLEMVRTLSHAIRSFSSYEVVCAGDLGDRGPRIDRVIDALRHQQNVSITWGNHDVEWMGACLGQTALIATVLRISLRYGRIAQLEEGYGIPIEPLEQLVQEAYADDPAERFESKGEDLRSPILLARMQKAVAILQFKLEGQASRRYPHWDLESRCLLHRIDPAAGTVTIDGATHPLLDRRFPTIDWQDPYRLSDAEARCIERFQRSFLGSSNLWRDMKFVADHGAMFLARDENVIFHGCMPVDATGEFLSLEVDGEPRKGRMLFEAIERSVRRAFRERKAADVDLLYYLWAGARSPCFGKDRMATFETYFVADKATHKETKNPYFALIHTPEFCRKVARELGVMADEPLIVNGHVPVKLDDGESPLKRSGLAVTIDGAFSEAYGDHGFTLVIDASETYLAKHHHFSSIDEAIERGADIVPTIQVLRRPARPIRIAETSRGEEIRLEIEGLQELVAAYRDRRL
ncbi:MAG: fructose-bisphosphatase class III [Labilithrix sp.]